VLPAAAFNVLAFARYARRAIRRQSDAHGPSLSAGFGPRRWKTDLVSVISAMDTPVGSRLSAAVLTE
jgi:hypothetical protein